jgi:hypothetical protein
MYFHSFSTCRVCCLVHFLAKKKSTRQFQSEDRNASLLRGSQSDPEIFSKEIFRISVSMIFKSSN